MIGNLNSLGPLINTVVLSTLFGSTQIEDELVLIPSCHISLDELGVYLLFEKKNTR